MTNFTDLDAIGLASAIARGEMSAREAALACIDEIEAQDSVLNAVVMQDFERALDRADKIDASAKNERGPLAGVPFLLKDNNLFIKGLPTTFGSEDLAEYKQDEDSDLVKIWKRAGLNIVGKTNLCEYALTFTTEPSWRGATRNPWNIERTPGGSSGGSACAVAARYTPVAHANDAGGSIRIPASCCGLFGLKPARGRMTLTPFDSTGWFGLNHEHVLTRSVRDCELLLNLQLEDGPFATVRPRTDPPRLKIGYTGTSLTGHTASPACDRALNDAVTLLESLGHTLVPMELPTELIEPFTKMPVLTSTGIRRTMEEAEQALGRPKNLEKMEILSRHLQSFPEQITAMDLAHAIAQLSRAEAIMDAMFDTIDIFMSPTLATPPVTLSTIESDAKDYDFDELFETTLRFGPYTMPFNLSGHPAMSVPLFQSDDGLPIGIQFAASRWGEARLFELAYELEEARPWAHLRPPRHGANVETKTVTSGESQAAL